jgi:enamine deaminase RidA (YjgF/YER057c/UK114 family)
VHEFRGSGRARVPRQASGSAWVDRLEGPVGAQGIAIYEQYRALLKREGGDLKHLLRYHIYQRDKRYFPVFDRVRREYEPAPPSSTAVGMGRFEPTDQARLCIDAIALRPAAEKTLGPREVRSSAAAHTAAATFSHVIGAGPYLFLAGQIPIDASKARRAAHPQLRRHSRGRALPAARPQPRGRAQRPDRGANLVHL